MLSRAEDLTVDTTQWGRNASLYFKEREVHLFKLAEMLQAHLTVMTRGVFEVVARAPQGYVWADNGQEELCDSQWDGESQSQVKKNVTVRMLKGIKKLDN